MLVVGDYPRLVVAVKGRHASQANLMENLLHCILKSTRETPVTSEVRFMFRFIFYFLEVAIPRQEKKN